MRSQKLRSMLTLFGMFWGTSALILLGAFGHGLYVSQEKAFKGLGENIVIQWPGRTSYEYEGLPKGRMIYLREADVDLLKSQVSELDAISIEYQNWWILAERGRSRIRSQVAGVAAEYGSMRNVFPDAGGRFINELDVKLKRRVCFIGNELKTELFGRNEAVGELIKVNGIPFTVIGVMVKKEQDSSYSGRDEDKIFMPYSTSAMMFGHTLADVIVWTAKSTDLQELAKARIREVLGTKYKFDPKDHEVTPMWDTTENMEFMYAFFGGFRVVLLMISLATLIVGGIGVANIMYVVVKERSREIGLKLSIGAKRWFILAQLLLETLVITFMGGIAGFIFAMGVIELFPLLNAEEIIGIPSISMLEASLSATMLMVIGILAGFFPARRAAYLNPVQALKL